MLNYQTLLLITTQEELNQLGVHVLSYATKEEFANRLEKRGFKVEHSYNSHGVPTLIVTW